MKNICLAIAFILLLGFSIRTEAQSANTRQFGFGLIAGEPTGLVAKIRTTAQNAVVLSTGISYFGAPRFGADYIWHFDTFRSQHVDFYAGLGGVVGFGESRGLWHKRSVSRFYDRSEGIGVAARGIMGINAYLPNTPIDFFIEGGLLLGLLPNTGSAIDGAIGVRFYP